MDRPPRFASLLRGVNRGFPFRKRARQIKRPVRKRVFERQLHLRFVKTRLRPVPIPGGCAAKQCLCHRLSQFASNAVELPRHSRFMLAPCASDLRQGELVHVIARQEHAFARRQAGDGSRERSIEPGDIPLAVRIGLLGIRALRQRMRAPLVFPEFRRGASRELVGCLTFFGFKGNQDRKSTRLNSSHVEISYAVFCLKKKKKKAGRGGVVREYEDEGWVER